MRVLCSLPGETEATTTSIRNVAHAAVLAVAASDLTTSETNRSEARHTAGALSFHRRACFPVMSTTLLYSFTTVVLHGQGAPLPSMAPTLVGDHARCPEWRQGIRTAPRLGVTCGPTTCTYTSRGACEKHGALELERATTACPTCSLGQTNGVALDEAHFTLSLAFFSGPSLAGVLAFTLSFHFLLLILIARAVLALNPRLGSAAACSS